MSWRCQWRVGNSTMGPSWWCLEDSTAEMADTRLEVVHDQDLYGWSPNLTLRDSVISGNRSDLLIGLDNLALPGVDLRDVNLAVRVPAPSRELEVADCRFSGTPASLNLSRPRYDPGDVGDIHVAGDTFSGHGAGVVVPSWMLDGAVAGNDLAGAARVPVWHLTGLDLRSEGPDEDRCPSAPVAPGDDRVVAWRREPFSNDQMWVPADAGGQGGPGPR